MKEALGCLFFFKVRVLGILLSWQAKFDGKKPLPQITARLGDVQTPLPASPSLQVGESPYL